MRLKRRIEIAVETEQILIFKRAGRPTQVWCAECDPEVEMVTPEEAVLFTGSSLRAVCRQVEAGGLHFRETDDGRLFICLNSLQQKNKTILEKIL